MRSRLLLALGVVLLMGCGGGDKPDGPGAEGFASAGCGNCHTFEPARAKGTVGPNLDRAHVNAGQVVAKVRGGGGGMPTFAGSLSARDIRAVAEFVAGGAAARGTAVVGPFEPDGQRLERCRDVDCRRQAFGNIAYREGPQAARHVFEAEQRR